MKKYIAGFFSICLGILSLNLCGVNQPKHQTITESSSLAENESLIDITDYSITVSSLYNDSPVGQTIEKLIDNNYYTKYLTFHPRVWIDFEAGRKSILKKYAITSGEDFPERDPKEWELQGSDDAINWDGIDSRLDVDFDSRNQRKEFGVPNNEKSYRFYRFKLSNNNGGILQLAEIELLGIKDENDKTLLAYFRADKSKIFPNDTVHFTDLSDNALNIRWLFEGGEPAESMEPNPQVVYPSSGKFKISLVVSSENDTITLEREEFVQVMKKDNWDDFVAPQINFQNRTADGNGAIYSRLVSNPQELIQQTCLEVCQTLYYSTEEYRQITQINYIIDDREGISAKGGSPPVIEISFSSRFLADLVSLNWPDYAIKEEIKKILVHEVTHGYQAEPVGAGVFAPGSDCFGFIEGVADAVKIRSGFFNENERKPGSHWRDGYTPAAYFLDWLHKKDEDFLYKFNKSAADMIPWSWDKATQSILGRSVHSLWDEYQNFLKGITTAINITSKNADEVKIWPNPCCTNLNIEMSLKSAEYKICNLTGKIVMDGMLKNGKNPVNICQLSDGIYIVTVSTNGKMYSDKLVVNK